MWLFTRLGFYSVTAGDKKQLQIRARNKEHLYNLKEAFPKILGDRKLIELPDRDYRYRYIVSPEEWGKISAKLCSEAGDYRNFKGECGKQVDSGRLDAGYEGLLHRVWHEHMGYQSDLLAPPKLRGGKGGRGRGALGYKSTTYAPESTLWRSHQSEVYDADLQDDDYVLDNREASEILNDLDTLPSRVNGSLFLDTEIGEVFKADSNRGTGKAKHRKG